ncbi:mannosyl-oligosaccharide alpha-1 2-mannosidase, partial [Clonorchis sinensis]
RRLVVRQLRCRRILVPACIISLIICTFAVYQNLGSLEQTDKSVNRLRNSQMPTVPLEPVEHLARNLQHPQERADGGLVEQPRRQLVPPKHPLEQEIDSIPIPQVREKVDPGSTGERNPPDANKDQQVEQPGGGQFGKMKDAELIPRSDVGQPQIKPSPTNRGTPITNEEVKGGEPKNATLVAIRNQLREMTSHAWRSYMKHARGHNELKPVSLVGHQPFVLGSLPMGATIVDALDTLYMMDLKEEFIEARNYVAEELNFDQPSLVSVFEFTIRYLGGLLTAYTFTLDKVFLDKAVFLAKRLLPAFETPTKLPMSLINLRTGKGQMFTWSAGRCALLAEVGTLHMEFRYLSELTGDPIYAQKVHCIRDILNALKDPKAPFFNHVNHRQLQWCSSTAGLSGTSDSFYEYLLKEWIRTNRQDAQARQMYDAGIKALDEHGLFKISDGGHLYIGTYTSSGVSNTMDHLACFAGGMFVLGATSPQDPWFQRGVEITRTCNYTYAASVTQLGPESFTFDSGVEGVPLKSGHKPYLLRPETVESYFYLWRFTKDEAYRIAALKVVQALEKYARTPGGYSGLKDVNSPEAGHDDVQQSFFIAETLKYLYLIFSEDTLFPLDRWVFNSEGHPLPVHNEVWLGNDIWPKPFAQPTSCSRLSGH